jgi:hypothetical protein
LSFSFRSAGKDSLSFVKSKESVDDLLKKGREIFTGIPDFSSDPVTGFGFGVRYILERRTSESSILYTLYLAKLKLTRHYTSNARELVMSLDIPYYKGTRWRFKVDFKAQQNPTNLYFGLTESTLRPLRLPSTPMGGPTYSTYSEYDRARKTLRSGEVGEAPFVTDALSNRFRETEYA